MRFKNSRPKIIFTICKLQRYIFFFEQSKKKIDITVEKIHKKGFVNAKKSPASNGGACGLL